MTILIMGVTGSGKTTIGSLLGQQLGWEFVDGDSFHSGANIEKMRRGIPLDDGDRMPWLEAIHRAMAEWDAAGLNKVLACSALKQSYRDLLCAGVNVRLVYLRGKGDLIRGRLQERHGHYATAQLVASQFADLEEPNEAVMVSIDSEPGQIVQEIRRQLGL